MATIRKRGDSYQIRVSCGYDTDGKQVIRTKSWKPSEKMTPKQIEKEPEIYTISEVQQFVDKLIQDAPLVYRSYFILAIYSGFRRGELCGLTWNDVDFENHTVSVNKALYHVKNKGSVLDTTKTESSNRTLKLPEEVFEFLSELKTFYENESIKFGDKWNENDFVFKQSDGKVLSPARPSKWLKTFCEKEGLKYVVPHSFRHLAASLMIDSGASVKTVQACLGHSAASTTLDIYAHSFALAQAKATEAIASNFKPA